MEQLHLTRFETLLGFVDHINTALAAHYAAIAADIRCGAALV
jgi:hypothetical protein